MKILKYIKDIWGPPPKTCPECKAGLELVYECYPFAYGLCLVKLCHSCKKAFGIMSKGETFQLTHLAEGVYSCSAPIKYVYNDGDIITYTTEVTNVGSYIILHLINKNEKPKNVIYLSNSSKELSLQINGCFWPIEEATFSITKNKIIIKMFGDFKVTFKIALKESFSDVQLLHLKDVFEKQKVKYDISF